MTFILRTGFAGPLLRTADSTTMIIAGILVGGLFALLVIGGVISNRRTALAKAGGGKFRKGAFRRRAAKLGLTKSQVRALEFIVDRYKVRNPYALLGSSSVLDNYLRKAMSGIDDLVSTDASKEAQKLTLYRIKQVVERNSQRSGGYSSSRQLSTKQGVTVSIEGGERYQSMVVSVLKNSIAIEVPLGDTGNQVRWKKWSQVKVNFWKNNGEGFSFLTKLVGYNTIKGVSAAFLQHSNRIQKSKQRKYRRRTLDRPCYFYPVRVLTMGSGKKQTKKAFVETKRGSLGTVIEVSAGGCSVKASRTLAQGALIKLDFETTRGAPVSSYGKVVNTRKEDIMGHVMHIMFTRVSRKYFNNINAFVYDYDNAG